MTKCVRVSQMLPLDWFLYQTRRPGDYLSCPSRLAKAGIVLIAPEGSKVQGIVTLQCHSGTLTCMLEEQTVQEGFGK